MANVFPNAAELTMWDWLMDVTSTPENLTLKLFQNDETPDASSVAGDFTEADFDGYSAKTLTRGSWGTPTTVSNKAEASYAQQEFECNGAGGNTIYGAYIVGATSGNLYWADRFASEVVMAENDILRYTPKLTLASEN